MDTVQRERMPARFSGAGLRKITPAMVGTIQRTDEFRLKETLRPGRILAAFKAAAPYLGYNSSIVHAIDCLFAFTDPLDWEAGSRPIVWPSAERQQLSLCLGESQVKRLNRRLVELGLVVMRDSPNGKRYGRRGPDGRIIEAYGFDLSPLVERQAEFVALAQRGQAAREQLAALKKRASVSRNGLRQLEQTARAEGIEGIDWDRVEMKISACAVRGVTIEDVGQYEENVLYLENIEHEVRTEISTVLETRCSNVDKIVEKAPKGCLVAPHITTTNQLNNLDSVIAYERSTPVSPMMPTVRSVLETRSDRPARAGGTTKQTESSGRKSGLKLTPDQLLGLAPRLMPYLPGPVHSWHDLVNAADWLRDDLGISKHAWGEACVVMGREQATVAVAIVSARPVEHFRGTPGAYFYGMVKKARSGELDLVRTIWGMRKGSLATTRTVDSHQH